MKYGIEPSMPNSNKKQLANYVIIWKSVIKDNNLIAKKQQ